MRSAQVLALCGAAAAQVFTTPVIIGTGVTPVPTSSATPSAITSTPGWGNSTASLSRPSTVITVITSTQVDDAPNEIATEIVPPPTAGATPRRMEGSVLGLLGFVIAGLLVI